MASLLNFSRRFVKNQVVSTILPHPRRVLDKEFTIDAVLVFTTDEPPPLKFITTDPEESGETTEKPQIDDLDSSHLENEKRDAVRTKLRKYDYM